MTRAEALRITGPINLGNPTKLTMRELAENVLAEVGVSSRMILQLCRQTIRNTAASA